MWNVCVECVCESVLWCLSLFGSNLMNSVAPGGRGNVPPPGSRVYDFLRAGIMISWRWGLCAMGAGVMSRWGGVYMPLGVGFMCPGEPTSAVSSILHHDSDTLLTPGLCRPKRLLIIDHFSNFL